MAPRHGERVDSFRTTRPFALIVATDPKTRTDISRRLRLMGTTTVFETATVTETRRLIADGIPRGLVVLDANLPDGSGVRLLPELRRLGFTRTVMLATTEDPQSVRVAMSAGVRGYLSLRNHRHPVPAIPHARPPTHTQAGPLSLSAREVQVLQLVAQGRSNRDVGEALSLSALTVKSHLARIGRKLGSGDRAEMVAKAIRAGLVT